MRKLCLLFLFLILPLFTYAENVPAPEGWVNDFAGVISPEYKEKLTSLIEELEQKTTTEIAVVTVNSISPYGEIEYARMLFDNWKPGKKGKDNGVLVFLAIKERRWRIETGYGVEGILPDGLCGEIGRNYMVPYFKEGKYGEGLYQGVAAITNVIAKNAHIILGSLDTFKETTQIESRSQEYKFSIKQDKSDIVIFFIFIGLILFLFLPLLIWKRDNYYYGGGGYWGSGGGGGGFGGGGFGGFGGGGGGGGGAGGGF